MSGFRSFLARGKLLRHEVCQQYIDKNMASCILYAAIGFHPSTVYLDLPTIYDYICTISDTYQLGARQTFCGRSELIQLFCRLLRTQLPTQVE